MQILLDTARSLPEYKQEIPELKPVECCEISEESNDSWAETLCALGEVSRLHKMDPDEKIVRKALLKAWLQILEKYARPGAVIPSAEEVRSELERVGVDAAVKAVVAKHWFVFEWMIEDEIRENVRKELDKFNTPEFIEDVKAAQLDPRLLPELRERIRRYVMNP